MSEQFHHERRVVGHLSGWKEQMSTCVCGKPWPCPQWRMQETKARSAALFTSLRAQGHGYVADAFEATLTEIERLQSGVFMLENVNATMAAKSKADIERLTRMDRIIFNGGNIYGMHGELCRIVHAAYKIDPKQPTHVCGLKGFDPMQGDKCAACDAAAPPKVDACTCTCHAEAQRCPQCCEGKPPGADCQHPAHALGMPAELCPRCSPLAKDAQSRSEAMPEITAEIIDKYRGVDIPLLECITHYRWTDAATAFVRLCKGRVP